MAGKAAGSSKTIEVDKNDVLESIAHIEAMEDILIKLLQEAKAEQYIDDLKKDIDTASNSMRIIYAQMVTSNCDKLALKFKK